ncbi:MAG TPA: hypothetical protein VNJ28_06065 [Candidatus Limnocylindrales bacterium]|jgi:hypothetical protein|nr:hypothetical protein [Candidatus Limnocylindrales bacterium]
MANLTITVDERVLRRARIRALEQGTSVNRLLADYLAGYAGLAGSSAAIDRFLELARESGGSSGVGGRSWSRDEAHERARVR